MYIKGQKANVEGYGLWEDYEIALVYKVWLYEFDGELYFTVLN